MGMQTSAGFGNGRAAERCLAAVKYASDDAIIRITATGRITDWNPAAKKLFGYSSGEAKNKSLLLLAPRGGRTVLRQLQKQLQRGVRISHREVLAVDMRGRPLDVSLTASPLRDRSGTVDGALLVVRDITRRKLGRSARLQRDRELRTLHAISRIILSPRSLEESYREIVRQIARATDFPFAAIALCDEERRTVTFRGSTGPSGAADRSGLRLPLEQTLSGVVIRTGKPLILTHALQQRKYLTRLRRWGRIETFVGYPMKVGGEIIGCLNLAHPENLTLSEETARWIESLANYMAELTERKRAEEDLRSSREQLRELSRHIQTGIEEERKRIAREIHDQLGQDLSLLQLELGLLEGHQVSDPDLRRKMKALVKLVDASIRTVQKISTDLRPPLLDDLGLGAAVEWAVREFRGRTGMDCHVTVSPPDLALDQERSTALFRVLQEALTNILRHARATSVDVRLARSGKTVLLKVRDNGCGISARQIADNRSVGLIGMRERVRPWGGSVAFGGSPGRGTEVSITLPVNP